MNDLSGNGNILFIIGFVVQLSSILFLVIPSERKAFFASNFVLLLGLTLGIISTLSSAIFSSALVNQNEYILGNWIRFDGLSLYFIFIVQSVAVPVTIYNFSYLRNQIERKRPVRSFVVFYSLLLISTQLVVIANHAIFFLVAWEVMSITAYLGMILEKEKAEVQSGSFYYFAASHVLVFLLYIMFFLLHNQAGSWYFSDYHLSFTAGTLVPVIFVLSFVGFGIKAGFIPFHFWLPRAHPVAPTVLSAFLSGVIIKTGIYGIMRTFLFVKPVPEWCGWLVLTAGMLSAIFGVWYALAQHEVKKLLAYHSVENIGIIGIGIGIGFIGSANNAPVLEYLGFGGALLHTFNHAIFKSLLFIGSGVVYQNLGTRNIELMGGIVHRAKYLAILFLIGSAAISGIPPFNGFISEFVIYTGFFRTANALHNYYPLLMLLFVVGLAFVGGLAVACFTKVNSIIFLGTERRKIKRFHVSIYDYVSMGIFALLCLAVGFYPRPLVGVVNKVLESGVVPPYTSDVLVNMNWFYMTAVFGAMALGVLILYAVRIKHERKYGRRTAAAWGCGYDALSPRMQYTASSFVDELNTIPKAILLYDKKVKISKGVFPVRSDFESHSDDFVDQKVVIPGYRSIESLVSKMGFLSQTDIRYYIAAILIIISIYCLMAFLWV